MAALAAKLGCHHYSIYKRMLKAACKSPDLFVRMRGVRASQDKKRVLARIFGGGKLSPGLRDVGLYSWLRTGGIRRNHWRHLQLNTAVT